MAMSGLLISCICFFCPPLAVAIRMGIFSAHTWVCAFVWWQGWISLAGQQKTLAEPRIWAIFGQYRKVFALVHELLTGEIVGDEYSGTFAWIRTTVLSCLWAQIYVASVSGTHGWDQFCDWCIRAYHEIELWWVGEEEMKLKMARRLDKRMQEKSRRLSEIEAFERWRRAAAMSDWEVRDRGRRMKEQQESEKKMWEKKMREEERELSEKRQSSEEKMRSNGERSSSRRRRNK